MVSVGVASLEVGEGLSPAVEAAAGRVVEIVVGLVAGAGADVAAPAGAEPPFAAETGRA